MRSVSGIRVTCYKDTWIVQVVYSLEMTCNWWHTDRRTMVVFIGLLMYTGALLKITFKLSIYEHHTILLILKLLPLFFIHGWLNSFRDPVYKVFCWSLLQKLLFVVFLPKMILFHSLNVLSWNYDFARNLEMSNVFTPWVTIKQSAPECNIYSPISKYQIIPSPVPLFALLHIIGRILEPFFLICWRNQI